MRQTWLSVLILLAFSFFLLTFGGCTEKDGKTDPTGPVIPDGDDEEEEEEEIKVWEVSIEYIDDVIQGHYYEIELTANLDSIPIGGFDLIISYNAAALTFTEAMISDYLSSCGWEYFTYRFGAQGNCDDDCPSGLVRIVGVAETNNGGYHPDYDCIAGITPLPIATLTFFVSNDRTLECTFQPLSFFWYDCGDNIISSTGGDTVALNRYVYDIDGNKIQDSAYGVPGHYGVPDSPCLDGGNPRPIRYVDFHNGGLDIMCIDIIDARGDLNVNGVSNEIADAVMFSNYFINGTAAFDSHVEASIAASDVNHDDDVLMVADFVYLIRIIVGDAIPPEDLVYPSEIAQVFLQNGTVSCDSPYDIGAGLFVFNFTGQINYVQQSYSMDMKYSVEGNELRVLVYNIGNYYIASGYGEIFAVDHTGDLNLVAIELATYQGAPIQATIHNLVSP